MFLRGRGLCIELPQLIVDPGIGCDCGAHVDPNGGCVNELDVRNAFRRNCTDVRRQYPAANVCFQSRNQALQHHGGFAGAGHPGDHRKPPLGQVNFQRLYGVDLRR